MKTVGGVCFLAKSLHTNDVRRQTTNDGDGRCRIGKVHLSLRFMSEITLKSRIMPFFKFNILRAPVVGGEIEHVSLDNR